MIWAVCLINIRHIVHFNRTKSLNHALEIFSGFFSESDENVFNWWVGLQTGHFNFPCVCVN